MTKWASISVYRRQVEAVRLLAPVIEEACGRQLSPSAIIRGIIDLFLMEQGFHDGGEQFKQDYKDFLGVLAKEFADIQNG